jgi:glycosyltransferase 2 family protein
VYNIGLALLRMCKLPSKTLSLLIKLVVAGSLVAWLIHSGRLEMDSLAILIHDPFLLMQCFAVWLICSVALGALRWMLLLSAMGVTLKYLRAFQLQLVGFFFNTVMPGSVGGDLIKAFYIIKQDKAPLGAVSMSVVLDRIVGLTGIFGMGFMVIVWDFSRFESNPVLMGIAAYVFFGLAAMVIFFAVCLVATPFDSYIEALLGRLRPLLKIYKTLRGLQGKQMALLGALGLTLLVQTFYLLLFYSIGQKLEAGIEFTSLAAVYPIGVLLTAVPIAPAGIGIGHAAFAELYRMVGAAQGANVFNIYLVTQLVLNLLGFFAYVRLGVTVKHVASKEETL